jgi:glycosyltransferase involved in cell wall biosynthesis
VGGFAYLFERFPAFSQTFCFREVREMHRQGVEFAVYSIRDPRGQPEQDFPDELRDLVRYLPESFSDRIRDDWWFRRRARKGQARMESGWGDDAEKRRIHEALWLAGELRRQKISHVHAHFAGMAARTAFWLKRLAGVTYSFTAHADDVFCERPDAHLADIVGGAEWIATETEFSARFLRDRFPEAAGKVHRVYNGIELKPVRLDEGAGGEPPQILSIGRYVEKKGFADLIAACERLGGREFECQIVGRGPLEGELRAQIDAAGLGDRVRLTGPKTQGEIDELLARAVVFVLACRNAADGGSDNLPTVIMEAMGAAVPVVSTRVAGVPEMVGDGVTGILVEAGDVAGIAAGLERLLGDREAGRRLGASGRAVCEGKFATVETTGCLRRLLGA